jgi:hypothetical protein
LALVIAMIPTAAIPATAPLQSVEGSVALPTRTPVTPTSGSGGAIQRMVYGATGSNEVFGYTFAIAESTWGGRFELDVLSGATGREDLDITFYTSLDPPNTTGFHYARKRGGEAGIVPIGTHFANAVLFDGADASFRYRAYRPAKNLKRAPPSWSKPGIDGRFGKADNQLARRLRSRSHVVIAIIDTGINPYHLAFRRPEYVVHPSRYIEGFPTTAPALKLSLGEDDYVKARKADDAATWAKVQERKLYWIPGTNIIGARAEYDWGGVPPADQQSRLILDDEGHGTPVASVAAGGRSSSWSSAQLGANPDALIVVVEGPGNDAVKWVSEQPWIDVMSASYSPGYVLVTDPIPYNEVIGVPDAIDERLPDQVRGFTPREYRYTGSYVVRDGRTACFSAGNGVTGAAITPDRNSAITPTSGPSWIVTVGAVSPQNGQDYWWHNVPVDVSSYGLNWPAAAVHSTEGETSFAGTSNATPLTCGVFSKALLDARQALRDTREGIHVASDGSRVPALGRAGIAGGLLADGRLERLELQNAVFKTAFPMPYDAERHYQDTAVFPDSPAYYAFEGYGIVNAASARRAIDVIRGRRAMPDRSDVDAWMAVTDALRDVFYPPEQYR